MFCLNTVVLGDISNKLSRKATKGEMFSNLEQIREGRWI